MQGLRMTGLFTQYPVNETFLTTTSMGVGESEEIGSRFAIKEVEQKTHLVHATKSRRCSVFLGPLRVCGTIRKDI